MKTEVTRSASVAGALAAAFAASACCLGPLLLAVLGIGGAGFLVALEPYRPLFGAVTVALLGLGFYLTYRKPKVAAAAGSSGDACGCEMPKANQTGKVILWVATVIVIIALAFPYLVPYLV